MRSLNILIADDDDQNQAMMKLILNRQGHSVKSAWSGIATVDAVKSEKFDLVFMDVHMPEMDGIEATRQIRKWENNQSHIPIVILTGSVPQGKTDEYKKAGADTYLFKPFDIKRISFLVQMIADESETSFHSENKQNIEKSIDEKILLDSENTILRFNNDTNLYVANLDEFIKSLPDRLANLHRAIRDRKWVELYTYTHNLKGVAANFGANQLASLAGDLEKYSQDKKYKLSLITIQKMNENSVLLANEADRIIIQLKS